MQCGNKLRPADAHQAAIDDTFNAIARERLHRCRNGMRAKRRSRQRSACGMLGPRFQSSSLSQTLLARSVREQRDAGQGHAASRQGSGLVEYKMRGLRQGFQR